MVEALVAKPHGNAERAHSMMAEDYDMGVRVKLLMSAGCDLAHGHQERVGKAGGLKLPRLANIEQDGRIRLRALLGKGFGGDFGV